MKFKGYMLVSDIDGTLITEEGRVTEANREAIRQFKIQGGIFTYASGRPPFRMTQFLQDAPVDTYAICYNGAAIYDLYQNKRIWESALSKNCTPILQDVQKKFPGTTVTLHSDEKIFLFGYTEAVRDYILMDDYVVHCDDYSKVDTLWEKAIFVQTADQLPKIIEYIRQKGYHTEYQFVKSSNHYYEILNKGISKGSALEVLCGLIQLDQNKTIAIGDNENDIAMIQAAGFGFAVENADITLKKAAPYITASNLTTSIQTAIAMTEEIKRCSGA